MDRLPGYTFPPTSGSRRLATTLPISVGTASHQGSNEAVVPGQSSPAPTPTSSGYSATQWSPTPTPSSALCEQQYPSSTSTPALSSVHHQPQDYHDIAMPPLPIHQHLNMGQAFATSTSLGTDHQHVGTGAYSELLWPNVDYNQTMPAHACTPGWSGRDEQSQRFISNDHVLQPYHQEEDVAFPTLTYSGMSDQPEPRARPADEHTPHSPALHHRTSSLDPTETALVHDNAPADFRSPAKATSRRKRRLPTVDEDVPKPNPLSKLMCFLEPCSQGMPPVPHAAEILESYTKREILEQASFEPKARDELEAATQTACDQCKSENAKRAVSHSYGQVLCIRHKGQWERSTAAVPPSNYDFASGEEAIKLLFPRNAPHRSIQAMRDPSLEENRHKDQEWFTRFITAAFTPIPWRRTDDKSGKFLYKHQREFNSRYHDGKYNPDTISARITLLFSEALCFHTGGISVYPIGGDNDGYKEDTRLSFVDRLKLIEDVLRLIKLVVMDCIEGRGMRAFPRHPIAFHNRKMQNQLGNNARARDGPSGKCASQGRTTSSASAEADDDDDDEKDEDDASGELDENTPEDATPRGSTPWAFNELAVSESPIEPTPKPGMQEQGASRGKKRKRNAAEPQVLTTHEVNLQAPVKRVDAQSPLLTVPALSTEQDFIAIAQHCVDPSKLTSSTHAAIVQTVQAEQAVNTAAPSGLCRPGVGGVATEQIGVLPLVGVDDSEESQTGVQEDIAQIHDCLDELGGSEVPWDDDVMFDEFMNFDDDTVDDHH